MLKPHDGIDFKTANSEFIEDLMYEKDIESLKTIEHNIFRF